MCIGGCAFGNVIVSSNGGEIEATVPDCSYCKFKGAKCPSPFLSRSNVSKYKCFYFVPDSNHVYYKSQWWS